MVFIILGSMEAPKKEMLTVTVDTNAMLYIKKTAGTTTWTFFGGMLLSLITIIGSLARYFSVELNRYTSNRSILLEMRLLPWLSIVTAIIFVIQLYFYRRFARQAHKALNHADGERFNEAFPILYRSSVLAIVIMVLSFLETLVPILLGLTL
jgi:Na+/H+ antiporter NhaD/arsenite permease-like protein